MQITSRHRLEVLFKRIPYAHTFRYIQIFKPRQFCFREILITFYIHTLIANEFFYIKDFNNEHIARFYFPFFPPQATSKLSEILYTDIVYTVNLDAIPASNDIKYIKELLRLGEQYQQIVKEKQHNK